MLQEIKRKVAVINFTCDQGTDYVSFVLLFLIFNVKFCTFTKFLFYEIEGEFGTIR